VNIGKQVRLIKKIKTCEVCGKQGDCDEVSSYLGGMVLCTKHKLQYKRHGRFFNRTYKDKNEIINYDNHAEIILTNKSMEIIARALISKEDVEKVSQLKWNASSSNGYVSSGCGKTQILLHRYILNAQEHEIVDHINRNKLDNQRENLRLCTHSKNSMNSSMKSNNTSGITGVWINKTKKKNKWVAEIFVGGKEICLGNFKNKEEAIKARGDAEQIYFKEFAPQNNNE
jgi:hypothetical protein